MKIRFIVIRIIELIGNPLYLGAVYCLFLFFITQNEIALYIYNLIFLVYLYCIDGKQRRRGYFVLALLFLPSIIKLPILILILTIFVCIKIEWIGTYFFYEKTKQNDFSYNIVRFYNQLVFIICYLFFMLLLLIPAINLYYYGYLSDHKEKLDMMFTIYFMLLMFVVVIWTIVSLSIYLIKSALSLETKHSNIFDLVWKFILTIVIFLILPDISFSVLYSYGYSMFFSDVGIVHMFQYAFKLNHQIPLSNEFMTIQNNIENISILNILQILNVITNKIINIIVISSIIISVFSNKLNLYLNGENKGVSNSS